MDLRHFPFRLFVSFLLIFLVIVPAVPAAEHTLNPGDSIQTAIDTAADGDIIILNPGTFTENNIQIMKNLTIRANTSFGGTAANTIVNAEMGGTIFNLTGQYHIYGLDNLTLENGYSSGNGGAIRTSSPDSIVMMTSSVIRNCSAQDGGAVLISDGSHVILTASEIVNCSAVQGGAIANLNGSSLFLFGVRISNCSAVSGGTIFDDEGSVALIAQSEISDSSADLGAAVYDVDLSQLIMVNSSVINCTATDSGGAVYTTDSGKYTNISSTTFTNCTATQGNGGAIYTHNVTAFNISSSTFTNSSALDGSAIYSSNSSGTLGFSRLYQNTGTAVSAYNGTLNATYNWWGSNAGPRGDTSGSVISDPWLVLGVTASPATVGIGQPALIRANMTFNSAGVDLSSDGYIPNGTPVTFAITDGAGSLSVTTNIITKGGAETAFTPTAGGTAVINASVASMSVGIPVIVTSRGSGGGSDSGSGSGGPSSITVTSPGGTAGQTVEFEIGESLGGNTGYVIETVSIVPSQTLGSTDLTVSDATLFTTPPGDSRITDGVVAIALVGVNPSAITSGTISFTVSGSWLSQHDLTPQNIVMMRNDGNGWSELPTAFVGQEGNAYTFTATTPGFSYFAITTRLLNATAEVSLPVNTPQTNAQVVPAGSNAPLPSSSPSGESIPTTAPVAIQTTAVPAAAGAGPGSPPLLLISGGLAGIVIVIVAGFFIRRRWIRRQNPALFREYD